ncbi:hypothetical protein [Riemerella anatipestifer]|uniref:hypothetical protein n=1 Tax=Riemerella anatipestifer TaxID=34085 RepID=UPI00129ED20C|nr:hypothetical protein [Riemerella anatipestifer]MBT0550956.1 hypothetical protein [Riemerella anatipestifer]MBT0553109.1 hypothetical protein [Riemerella anatipestifer]MCE3023801.1 hypothetical protein [Riemerella anatipestifer]MCU7559548.1 hypothetical protein [Riemerella anatipestifer]MDY3448732.1 hypothetical protein [Riemerella anatipestifer]
MKKVILLASGVVVMSLMSFATSEGKGIIEVKGNVVTVKDTGKISEKDLRFLSENIVGWEACDYQSVSNECTTRYKVFPDSPTTQTAIKEILAKYE